MPDERPRPSAQEVIHAQAAEFHRDLDETSDRYLNDIFGRQIAEFHRIFSQIPKQEGRK